jgi:hypothetical protein
LKYSIVSIVIGLIFAVSAAYSQDLNFAKVQVKLLTSPEFHGRGYVKKGDEIAAQYLTTEFTKFGLTKFGVDYDQHYHFMVNTFPGKMSVRIDGKTLVPGIDYLVYPASSGVDGRFDIETLDSTLFRPGFKVADLFKTDHSRTFFLLDTLGWNRDKFRKQVFDLLYMNMVKAAGIILLTDNDLIHSVSQYSLPFCSLIVKRTSIPKHPRSLLVNIKSKEIDHQAVNIIGYIPGKVDSFLVITAHYDHLGMMGKDTYFPGANDNASGTAMLLDFARKYSTMHPKYSIAFMLFSGEEVGLLGSGYYTEHPLFPLSKIKMLVNLDMMGSGSGGVTVFNGSSYPKEFHKLDSLDKALRLNMLLISKGISKASDHYVFYLKKVPVLFFNCNGKEVGYHIVGDTFEALPFTVYEKLYKLIDAYLKTF